MAKKKEVFVAVRIQNDGGGAGMMGYMQTVSIKSHLGKLTIIPPTRGMNKAAVLGKANNWAKLLGLEVRVEKV